MIECDCCKGTGQALIRGLPASKCEVCNGTGRVAVTVGFPNLRDAVNHPAHYTSGKIEVIDIMESIITSMPLTPWEATLTAQVVKYIARWKNKGGAEDLKKAEWYLKRLIGEVEK